MKVGEEEEFRRMEPVRGNNNNNEGGSGRVRERQKGVGISC